MTAQKIKISAPDILALLIPFGVYLFTCAPTIGFSDTAILIDNIYRCQVDTHVNTHALTVILGNLFLKLPFEDIAYKANLMSVTAGAISVFLLYLAVVFALGKRLIGAIVALLFLFSQSMWWHSTVIENYAVSSIITGGALIAFVKLYQTREPLWVYILCALSGLGLFNHVQMGFLSVGVCLTMILSVPVMQKKILFILVCGTAYLVGLLPWLITLCFDAYKSGDFFVALNNAFFGQFGNVFFSSGVWGGIRSTAVVFFLQFPNIFLPFILVGIFPAWKKMRDFSAPFWGITVFWAINTFCFTFYSTWDRFAFLLQSFMIFSFFGAFAVDAAFSFFQKRNLAVLYYALLACFAVSIVWTTQAYDYICERGKNSESIWHKNYHNNYSKNLYEQSRFIIVPNKRNYLEVEQFAERLFEKLPKNAIYLDDDSRSYYPVADYYQKYYNKRKDVQMLIINSWGVSSWGYTPEHLADLVVKAYYQNKPFFVVSLQWPYTQILSQLPRNLGINFDRFYLTENRYIFRLITHSEAYASAASSEYVHMKMDKGYVDFHLFQVTNKNNVLLSQQIMAGFKGRWRFDDQLFMEFTEQEGSIVELILNSEKSGLAEMQFFATKANDFGIVNVSLNGEPLFSNLDLFDKIVLNTKLQVPEEVMIKKGKNRIIFSLVGKNSFSAGTKAGFDGISYQFVKK